MLTFGTSIGKNPDEKWYYAYPVSEVDVALMDKVPFLSDKIYRLYKFDFDPDYQAIGKTYVLSNLPIQLVSSYFKNRDSIVAGILDCHKNMRKEDTESLVPYRNCARVNYIAKKKKELFCLFLVFLYLCTIFVNSTQVK